MRNPNDHARVVLLAEDNPADQELARRVFAENRYGVRLEVVADGEAALDYLHNQGPFGDTVVAPRPDLVLLDLNMPRVDGREVLRRMRDHDELRTIPVVVLTSSRNHEEVARSYRMGANSFVTKPMDMTGFESAVEKLTSYWFGLATLPSR